MLIVGSIAAGATFYYFGMGIIPTINFVLISCANIYSMSILVILLAYGLIKLPIHLWKYSDNNYNLIKYLKKADHVRKSYRASLIDYHE